jgi:hypothetical protein
VDEKRGGGNIYFRTGKEHVGQRFGHVRRGDRRMQRRAMAVGSRSQATSGLT